MSLLHTALAALSPVASVILSVAIMLFFGFAMTRLTKLLRLPNVTAYIITGILLGPYVLDLVPAGVAEGMDFLSDIALAFIAFGTGEFFKLPTLKKNGVRVFVITLAESLTATAVVFVVTHFLLGIDLAFSAVLSALAAATAPASTLMTIRQTGAHGDFVDTLLQVVALDDIVGLVAYSISISVALAATGGALRFMSILRPILINLGVLLLGAVFGFLLKLLMPKKRSTDNRLIIGIATLFAFCGICAVLDVSPLLGCMSMGTVYSNIAEDDKLFRQFGYFSPPILLLFFVRSGLTFRLDALWDVSSAIAGVPLLAIGVAYFFARILGKYGGALLGCLLVGKPKATRRYLGFALIPQAGVAIGLAALGARTLGGETGSALQTVILASSVLYELIGPASAKLALYLSGSYRDTMEALAPVETLTPEGKPKSAVELLIERIQKIQTTLPTHELSEEEQAFTEAAEEQYQAMNPNAWRRFPRGRR